MNIFNLFFDFAQYLGTSRAVLMVVAYFFGDFILKKAPAALELRQREGSKLANFFLLDLRTGKCPNFYENY